MSAAVCAAQWLHKLREQDRIFTCSERKVGHMPSTGVPHSSQALGLPGQPAGLVPAQGVSGPSLRRWLRQAQLWTGMTPDSCSVEMCHMLVLCCPLHRPCLGTATARGSLRKAAAWAGCSFYFLLKLDALEGNYKKRKPPWCSLQSAISKSEAITTLTAHSWCSPLPHTS